MKKRMFAAALAAMALYWTCPVPVFAEETADSDVEETAEEILPTEAVIRLKMAQTSPVMKQKIQQKQRRMLLMSI